MKKILFLSLTFFFSGVSYGQPDTDIFVLEIVLNENIIAIKSGRNVTKHTGYDNQPFFFSENEMYYTAATKEGQTEIFSIKIDKDKKKQKTQTTESEYSPTPIPNTSSFSVIQVEKDGSQRLWKFPKKGKGAPSVLLENLNPVGYHVWEGSDLLAIFVLGEPNTLQTAELSSGTVKKLAENVGRCFKNIPGSSLVSFVHKLDTSNWEIKSLNILTNEIKTLTSTLEGKEDYEWLNENTIVMGKGSKLYKFNLKQDRNWVEVGDLSMFGIYDFNRLAVSPDKKYLAVVATDFDTE